MVRTVISLDPEDKAWLDKKAKEEKISMTELVRRAIKRLRRETEQPPPDCDQVLRETSGMWTRGDGLEYQDKVREEWDKRN